MAKAIYQVIEEHYVKNSVKFEIFFNSNDLDVMSKTLKLIKELKDYRITEVNDEDKNNITLQQSGIFIFDTLENFKKLMYRMKTAANGPKEVNMLIYCQDILTTRVRASALVKRNARHTWSFLFEGRREIILKTVTLFTSKRCRSYELTVVNKFSRKSMKWSESTFFQTMIRDFHGCPLFFGVFNILPDGSIPNAELFYALASHLNFEVKLVTKLNSSKYPSDHNFSSLFQIDGKSFYRFDFSVPLYSSSYVIAVPPGAPYTPIETFFLPFDLETWILFTLVFILAFSVVVVVKLSRSRSLRILIIGENVSMPGLNIFGIFMGIGMMTLPRRNISRILLMNFILFSLIMRTAFQGKYFEFMTGDVRKRPIQTIAELIEKNFTLYVRNIYLYEHNKDIYKNDLGRLNYGGAAKNVSYVQDLHGFLQDPNFKGCILDELRRIASLDKFVVPWLKFTLLQEEFGSVNFGVFFNARSFMSPIFRLKIEQLVTGGVWEKMESWKKHVYKEPATKPKPQHYDTVLTLQHLSIGFYIWLLMILLSTLAFTGEMLKYWGPKVARMLFFYYVMSRFYKMQRSMH